MNEFEYRQSPTHEYRINPKNPLEVQVRPMRIDGAPQPWDSYAVRYSVEDAKAVLMLLNQPDARVGDVVRD